MDATVVSVGQLFSDDFRLELPFFQRGYAWQVQHVARLIDNLEQAISGVFGIAWYPLGNIILVAPPGAPEAGITDGHQRLMTLTILLAVLRDLETDPVARARLAGHITDVAGRPRLATARSAQRTLADLVQRDGSTLTAAPQDDLHSESEDNILATRDWLQQRLGLARMTAEARRQLADFVLARCLLSVVRVSDEVAAQLLFSTMHDTGLRPDPGDLFKADVLAAIDPEERQERQEVWEAHEARLGRAGLDHLVCDIATIAVGRPVRSDAPHVLRQHYGLGDAANARRFVDERLAPLGRRLVDVFDSPRRVGHADGGISRRTSYLVELVVSHDTWRAPLLKWLELAGSDSAATAEFVRRLEARAFMNQLLGLEPHDRERQYMRLLREIEDGRALDKASALAIAADERREVWSVLTTANFARRRNVQLLLRINAAIDGDDLVRTVPIATIEHVFPKKPRAKSSWIETFSTSADTALRGTLGNLALFTQGEQNEARNRDWMLKRAVLAASPFAITRLAAMRATWGPDDVRARSEELATILFRSWGLAKP
jgi:hypothetical protein